MKRKPIAEDRDLADILRKLKPGDYSINVQDNANPFMGLAKLKHEGSIEITFEQTTVLIRPNEN